MLGRVTLNLPEDALGPLQRKDGDPTFDEAWQAQSLAIADTLVDAGVVTATGWAEALGTELKSAARAGAADNADTYYLAVLGAVEKLLRHVEIIGPDELDARVEAWRQAYLTTPHGEPVELQAALKHTHLGY
jgi:Nitrile hydratase beta subunit